MILKGMDFNAEDLIRVVSALGEIKKKKEEKKGEEENKFSVEKHIFLRKMIVGFTETTEQKQSGCTSKSMKIDLEKLGANL